MNRFTLEGAQVAVLDRLPASQLPQTGLNLLVDVTSREGVEEAFLELDRIWGGVDILVANAGVSLRHRFADITSEEWQRVLATNLTGVFYCAQSAVRRMARAQSGTVLMTASTNGYRGHPLYADYNASKAGVILLMKTLAAEHAPWIRANAVCPGYVLTPMQRAEYTEEMLETVNRSLPLGRHAEPEEVAALFAFLASDDAQYITGQCITIDGGETI